MAKKTGGRKQYKVGDRIKMIFDTHDKFAKRKLTEEERSLLGGSIAFHMEDYKDQEVLKEIQKINAWLEGQTT